MPATVTPVFTDNVSIITTVLGLGNVSSQNTYDLRTAFGAYLFVKLGRGGTTALTNPLVVRISRVLNNNVAAIGIIHPVGLPQFNSQTAAANSTTQSVTTASTAGTNTLNVASITGFAAGDLICIQDGAGTSTRLEWQRVSKTSGTVLTLDDNLVFTHTTAQSGGQDTVRNKADVFAPVWLPGGSLWEVIFDYGNGGAGDSMTCQALGQTYASEQIV